jgi:hypothetical protein
MESSPAPNPAKIVLVEKVMNNEDSKLIEKLLTEILTLPNVDKEKNVQQILHRVRCLEGVILGLEKVLIKKN